MGCFPEMTCRKAKHSLQIQLYVLVCIRLKHYALLFSLFAAAFTSPLMSGIILSGKDVQKAYKIH